MFRKSEERRWRKSLASLIVLVSLIATVPANAMAWGNEGHQITALIAYDLLTPRARNNVVAVLEGRKITALAIWPDDLKRAGEGCVIPGLKVCNPNYRPETSEWHFVDIPLADTNFNPEGGYCHASRYGDCIIPAIEGFRGILNKSTNRAFADNSDEQKRKLHDALSFVTHLVGDLHQPLHCADNKDAGGNAVLVTWQNEPVYTWDKIWNLHSVWDEYIVDRNIKAMPTAPRTFTRYAKSLFNGLSQAERDYAQLRSPGIEPGTAENVIAWAEGSHALAKTSTYVLPSTKVKTSTRGFQKKDKQGNPLDIIVLDENYFTGNMPVVEKQLRLGGIRLARILNEIYDKDIH